MALTSKRKATKRAAPKRRAAAARTVFRAGHQHEDDSECACDFEFSEADATPDAMLPAARGGVEGDSVRAARRG